MKNCRATVAYIYQKLPFHGVQKTCASFGKNNLNMLTHLGQKFDTNLIFQNFTTLVTWFACITFACLPCISFDYLTRMAQFKFACDCSKYEFFDMFA